MDAEKADIVSLAEERIRLERETLEIERARLAAARTAFEAEMRTGHRRKSILLAAGTTFITLVAFAAGVLLGLYAGDARSAKRTERRLAQALSEINKLPLTGTNGVPSATRQNVSILVIQ